MLYEHDFKRILDQIQYKPGWAVDLHWPAWISMTRPFGGVEKQVSHEAPYLQVRYDGTGAYGTIPWTGRKWQLSRHMTTSEIVYTAFKAVLAAEEHETRECFTYKGVPVCGPHFDVEQIVAATPPVDVRTDAMEGA